MSDIPVPVLHTSRTLQQRTITKEDALYDYLERSKAHFLMRPSHAKALFASALDKSLVPNASVVKALLEAFTHDSCPPKSKIHAQRGFYLFKKGDESCWLITEGKGKNWLQVFTGGPRPPTALRMPANEDEMTVRSCRLVNLLMAAIPETWASFSAVRKSRLDGSGNDTWRGLVKDGLRWHAMCSYALASDGFFAAPNDGNVASLAAQFANLQTGQAAPSASRGDYRPDGVGMLAVDWEGLPGYKNPPIACRLVRSWMENKVPAAASKSDPLRRGTPAERDGLFLAAFKQILLRSTAQRQNSGCATATTISYMMLVGPFARVGYSNAGAFLTMPMVHAVEEPEAWIQQLLLHNSLTVSADPMELQEGSLQLQSLGHDAAAQGFGGGGSIDIDDLSLLLCPGHGHGQWQRPLGSFTSVYEAKSSPEDTRVILRLAHARSQPWLEAQIHTTLNLPAMPTSFLRDAMPDIICFGRRSADGPLNDWMDFVEGDEDAAEALAEEWNGRLAQERAQQKWGAQVSEPLSVGRLWRRQVVYAFDRKFIPLWSLDPWQLALVTADAMMELGGLFRASGFVHHDVSPGNIGTWFTRRDFQHRQVEMRDQIVSRLAYLADNDLGWAGEEDWVCTAAIIDRENSELQRSCLGPLPSEWDDWVGRAPARNKVLSATQSFWSEHDWKVYQSTSVQSLRRHTHVDDLEGVFATFLAVASWRAFLKQPRQDLEEGDVRAHWLALRPSIWREIMAELPIGQVFMPALQQHTLLNDALIPATMVPMIQTFGQHVGRCRSELDQHLLAVGRAQFTGQIDEWISVANGLTPRAVIHLYEPDMRAAVRTLLEYALLALDQAHVWGPAE